MNHIRCIFIITLLLIMPLGLAAAAEFTSEGVEILSAPVADPSNTVPVGDPSKMPSDKWKKIRDTTKKVVIDEKPTTTVEIYITDWCPYSAQAIKFLQANHIQYVAYDIEKDSEAAERKKGLSGRKGVPFAIINGKKIYGFSEKTYSKALGLKWPSGQP